MTYVVRAVGWLAFAALVMGTLIQVSSYFYTPDNAHTALATGFFVMAVVLYMSLRATES